ncbi:hypothetical protein CFI00_11955 [Nocardioides sp. S5]|uniref:DUF5701 family protein n=1 Tax=Nocardioides sp. S5 TaxID=2017486 RepID=UPI001A8EA45E|nr:DUF5701 family protein [Nocardioides sp. S5]QSR31202.1 hypothetical protein CFI00_11955 [Nocardioides sp. S5]
MLPSPTVQADRLISLGVHEHAGIAADQLRAAAATSQDGLLVTAAPASVLAALMTRGERTGFVVEDMTDVDSFDATDAAPLPSAPYVVGGLDRGDEHANRSPEECLPKILAAGRSPLTLVEGVHWVLQGPDVLERNRCFMTIGSRLRKANGTYDARTPALWISNGTGRDGRERKDAPKVGWCWWGNRHTWLGMASCSGRTPLG